MYVGVYVCTYMYMYISVYVCMHVCLSTCLCMYVRMYICIPSLTVGNGSENQSRCLDFEMAAHDSTPHTHKLFTFFLESDICNVLLLYVTSFLRFIYARSVKRANSPLVYSHEKAFSLMRRRSKKRQNASVSSAGLCDCICK